MGKGKTTTSIGQGKFRSSPLETNTEERDKHQFNCSTPDVVVSVGYIHTCISTSSTGSERLSILEKDILLGLCAVCLSLYYPLRLSRVLAASKVRE